MPAIASFKHPRYHSPLSFSERTTFHPPSPIPTSSSFSSSSTSSSSSSSLTLTTDFVLESTSTSSPSSPTVEAQVSTTINPVPFVVGAVLGIIILILWAMLLLYTLRKRSKTVTKFFLGSHSSQCDQESRSSRSRSNTSEINLSSLQGDGKSLKGKVNKPELSSPKMSSAPLPYISSSKNSPSVSKASDHVLYTPSQMLSVPQRIASAPIHVPDLPCDQDSQDHSTGYTNSKDMRKGIHSDEILIIHHKRALPRALPLTSAPPALTAKQILTAQKVDRVSRLPSKKLLHLFPPPPPPPSSPPPAIPSSASSSVSSSPASSPPPINYSPAPCVYLSTPPSSCSSNNASPLLKKGRRRSQSASATSPPKTKTMIPVPVTRSSRSFRAPHTSDQHRHPVEGLSSSPSVSRKARHQRCRSSVLDGSNFSAPDLLQHCPNPPPPSPMLHSRPRLAESDPLRFPISTPMIVQIPRPVTWTFKAGRPRSQSTDAAPSTLPMTPPRSRNGSVSSSGPRVDKRRQSVTSNSSTVFSHGTNVTGGSVSGSSVYTHCDSYDSDNGYAIASLFQQPYHQYQKKQSMESSRDHDDELHAIITDAISKTVSGSPVMSRPMPMPMPLHATP